MLSHIVSECINVVTARDWALLVPRGIENFPGRKDRLNGTIDVWWIVRILDIHNDYYENVNGA